MSDDRDTLTRREFLRGSGAAAALVATGGIAGRSSATEHTAHWREKPDHVSLTFDQVAMEEYRPRLEIHHLDVEPSALYGWIASSPEHETDVYVYFAKYATQRGISLLDSHMHDREPFYVFVDPSDGSVQEVAYSGYHWFRASNASPPVDGDTHVTARVVNPHHHFVLSSESAIREDVPVESLVDEFDIWLSNGWGESLHPGAATNPWVMRSRESWWREKDWEDKIALTIYDAYRLAGLAGADEADI
ncbi:twin-arginine translocation signal domain-containing protein [Halopenitus persicus]|uniref:twin-arginine translocation signal domain-containing protein n=1 Tax=Halopenitus persicus TaxID=1048396 RepID=UPI000BBA99B3|nr:twin-arginine translocation signal domain-containing protein [Halopenitus persicus]